MRPDELAAEVVRSVRDSETWEELGEMLDDVATAADPAPKVSGLSGWQPTRATDHVEWLPRMIGPHEKLRLIDASTSAIRRAETTEAGIRAVLRIAIRAAKLAGA